MSKFFLENINKNTSSDDNEVQVLLKKLEALIPAFSNSKVFQQIDENSDEDHYTELLIKFLDKNTPSRFKFFNQATQNKSGRKARTVDIGIYLSYDELFNYIFCMEAKYLPTSNYVTGDSAAIKRFKKCEHGLSNRNPKIGKPLPENGIVAYVKKDDFTTHENKINQEIIRLAKSETPDKFNLVWAESEQLQKTKFDYKFISNHSRENAPNVKLHHFWGSVK
jgi:hypothetical protein